LEGRTAVKLAVAAFPNMVICWAIISNFSGDEMCEVINRNLINFRGQTLVGIDALYVEDYGAWCMRTLVSSS